MCKYMSLCFFCCFLSNLERGSLLFKCFKTELDSCTISRLHYAYNKYHKRNKWNSSCAVELQHHEVFRKETHEMCLSERTAVVDVEELFKWLYFGLSGPECFMNYIDKMMTKHEGLIGDVSCVFPYPEVLLTNTDFEDAKPFLAFPNLE